MSDTPTHDPQQDYINHLEGRLDALERIAAAWDAVVAALHKARPGWLNEKGTGAQCAVRAIERLSTAREPKDAPREVLEWIWHMDLHLTEHDERHAGIALRAAWPHVREYLVKLGEELGAERSLVARLEDEIKYGPEGNI